MGKIECQKYLVCTCHHDREIHLPTTLGPRAIFTHALKSLSLAKNNNNELQQKTNQ